MSTVVIYPEGGTDNSKGSKNPRDLSKFDLLEKKVGLKKVQVILASKIVKKDDSKVDPLKINLRTGSMFVKDALYRQDKFIFLAGLKKRKASTYEEELEKFPKSVNLKSLKSSVLEKKLDLYAKKPDSFRARWEVALIDKKLVFRIKIDKNFKEIFGYTSDTEKYTIISDVKQFSTKTVKSDTFRSSSFIVLDPSEVGVSSKEKIDLSNPLKFSVTINVPGMAKKLGMMAEIKKLHEKVCKDMQKDAAKIIDKLHKAIALDEAVKRPDRKQVVVEDAVDEAQDMLDDLMDVGEIEERYQTDLAEIIKKSKKYSGHYLEWKFQMVFKSIKGTLNTVLQGVKLGASAGSDATAYLALAKQAYKFYELFKDFKKTEEEAAKELSDSIQLYKDGTEDYIGTVEKIYRDSEEESKGTLSRLASKAGKAYTATVEQIRKKFPSFAKSIFGVSKPDPHVKYIRYLKSLGQAQNKLNRRYNNLTKRIDKFKNSPLNTAVKVWKPLQDFKAAAEAALVYFQDRKKFADKAKAEIEAAGITVDDRTTLEKLVAFRDAVRNLDMKKIIDEKQSVGDILTKVKNTYEMVDGLVSEVKELAS